MHARCQTVAGLMRSPSLPASQAKQAAAGGQAKPAAVEGFVYK